MLKLITSPLSFLIQKRNWIALITLTISLLGGYACYDAPGALAVWLEDDLGIAPTKLGILYSGYYFKKMSKYNHHNILITI